MQRLGELLRDDFIVVDARIGARVRRKSQRPRRLQQVSGSHVGSSSIYAIDAGCKATSRRALESDARSAFTAFLSCVAEAAPLQLDAELPPARDQRHPDRPAVPEHLEGARLRDAPS